MWWQKYTFKPGAIAYMSDEKQAIKQTALLQSALCALINLIQWLQSAPKKCVSSVRLPMTTVLDEILHLQEPHTCAERKRLNSHRSPWAHSGCKNHWTRRQRASSLCQNGGVKVFRPSPNVCRAKMMKWFSRSFVIWCFLWCVRLKGENREPRIALRENAFLAENILPDHKSWLVHLQKHRVSCRKLLKGHFLPIAARWRENLEENRAFCWRHWVKFSALAAIRHGWGISIC